MQCSSYMCNHNKHDVIENLSEDDYKIEEKLFLPSNIIHCAYHSLRLYMQLAFLGAIVPTYKLHMTYKKTKNFFHYIYKLPCK